MKAYINGITFTELLNGEGVAIVHADAELVDTTEDEFEKQVFNDEIEDYLIPAIYKGMILFELKDGKTAFRDTE